MNQSASLSQPMNMNGPMGFTQSQIQNPTTSMPSQRQMPQNMAGQGLMDTVVSDSSMQVVRKLFIQLFLGGAPRDFVDGKVVMLFFK